MSPEFEGFGDVEIPDRLPEDVGRAIQFFPLRSEEKRTNGFLWFLVLKAVVQRPPEGGRTVGGIYKLCWACSRTIQSVATLDVKRAQGIVLGLVRALEASHLIRCNPPLAAETIVNPGVALTTVEPAGLLLDPAVQRFLTDLAYGAALWAARDELSHALAVRTFPE